MMAMAIDNFDTTQRVALLRLEDMLCPRRNDWGTLLPHHVSCLSAIATAEFNREASESYMLPDAIEDEYIDKYVDHMEYTIRLMQRKKLDAIFIEAKHYIVGRAISVQDFEALLITLVGRRTALARQGVHMLDLMTGAKINYLLTRIVTPQS